MSRGVEPITLPIPAGFDLKQAAALPEALFTAWLTPIVDSVMPLARVSDAHARMEPSVHIGKILLEVAH